MSKIEIPHEFFEMPPDMLRNNPNTWFSDIAPQAASAIINNPDIHVSRLLLANFLLSAWNPEDFFLENSTQLVTPDELDRMNFIIWLQKLASYTGLLHGSEIREINRNHINLHPSDFLLETTPQPSFEELATLTRDWKKQGLTIGIFPGSFDPVTSIHAAAATEASLYCDKLIIAFDGDELLMSRKGSDRPRYPLKDRREKFHSLWMTDATATLRAKTTSDIEQYITDYKELNADIIFLANIPSDQELPEKVEKIKKAGANPEFLHFWFENYSSTQMLARLSEWGLL